MRLEVTKNLRGFRLEEARMGQPVSQLSNLPLKRFRSMSGR
jgi:hypothetical protein